MRRLLSNLSIPLSDRRACRVAVCASLSLFICHAGARVSPAQTQAQTATIQISTSTREAADGIKLYQNGNSKEAVKLLRAAVKKQHGDADAWHFLGLAYHREGKLKDAVKAFDRAIELRPNYSPSHSALAYLNFTRGHSGDAERQATRALELDAQSTTAHLVLGMVNLKRTAYQKAIQNADAALKIDANYAAAYFLKGQALSELYWRGDTLIADVARGSTPLPPDAVKEVRETQFNRLEQAADNLETYLRLNPKDPEAEIWREQVESMRNYRRLLKSGVYTQHDVTQRAIIHAKPEPMYTEEARRYGTSGFVRMKMILGADGRIHNIIVVRGLSHGLTEAALRAARGIKFTPAIRNGIPVSQFVTVEYSFRIL